MLIMPAKKKSVKAIKHTPRKALKTKSRIVSKKVMHANKVHHVVRHKHEKISQGLAIVALILNMILLPGLGTLIGGRTKEGIWQLVLFLVGLPLSLIFIGIPMLIGAWVWGIFSGVKIVQESSR